MSPAARAVPIVLGSIMTVGGIVLVVVTGGGWVLAGLGLLIVLSVFVEGRYRTGRVPARQHGRWQRTAEREIDSETGSPVEVWFDPVTGARDYRPLGSDSAS